MIKTDINGEMHWTVSSVNFDNYKADYINASYNLLNEYNVKNSYVYFIVGFGDYPKRALVIFRENSNNAEFIVIDDFKVNSENEVEFLPNTELGKRTYTYSEFKQLAAVYAVEKGNKEGALYTGASQNPAVNNTLQYALIAGGAVLAVSAAAGIILAVKKKKTKSVEV